MGNAVDGFQAVRFLPSLFSILSPNPIASFTALKGFWILPENIDELLAPQEDSFGGAGAAGGGKR